LWQLAENKSETLPNRVDAVIALGKITFTDSAPLLLRLLKDQDGDIRAAACNALGHFGADMELRNRCVQAVLRALHDPSERVKMEEAQAVGELADVRELKSIQEMSVDAGQTVGVRQAAANAAGKIKMAATARI
jgi:HEAT repeat protein